MRKKRTDSVYEEGKAAAGKAGRIYEEAWGGGVCVCACVCVCVLKEEEEGRKNKGSDGYFSTLRALRLSESLPLSLYT